MCPDNDPMMLDQSELDALLASTAAAEAPATGEPAEPAAEAAAPEPSEPDATPAPEPPAADTQVTEELLDQDAIASLLADAVEAAHSYGDEPARGGAPSGSAFGGSLRSAGHEGERVGDRDLLADVVLEISAEIGRAELTIEEILKLHSGSLVELDKLAGEPVELYVNDRCIARGEVVVVDDNFGIRITELGGGA